MPTETYQCDSCNLSFPAEMTFRFRTRRYCQTCGRWRRHIRTATVRSVTGAAMLGLGAALAWTVIAHAGAPTADARTGHARLGDAPGSASEHEELTAGEKSSDAGAVSEFRTGPKFPGGVEFSNSIGVTLQTNGGTSYRVVWDEGELTKIHKHVHTGQLPLQPGRTIKVALVPADPVAASIEFEVDVPQRGEDFDAGRVAMREYVTNAMLAALVHNCPDIEVLALEKSSLTNLGPIAGLQRLRQLRIWKCHNLRDWTAAGDAKSLEQLEIGFAPFVDAASVAGLPNLRSLQLVDCEIESLAPLGDLRSLQHLELRQCTELRSLAAIEGMTGLRRLEIVGCKAGLDLSPILRVPPLEQLSLPNSVTTDFLVDVVETHDTLTRFDLSSVRHERLELSVLRKLRRLTVLKLPRCRPFDGRSIAQLPALTSLSIGQAEESDLEQIAQLDQLEHLELRAASARSLSALTQLPRLTDLDLVLCENVHPDEVQRFERANGDCDVEVR